MAPDSTGISPEAQKAKSVSASAPAHEGRAQGAARPLDQAGDPSSHFIVEPPQRPTKFRSWFALAVFFGILMALAIVAITA
ncbi:MAG TPA: hypothetical protein VJR23_00790 [Candidatus Acidoferrales bacterium]|nr:hypothetical protein [Candidatus Acidoferrales bacterium]